MKPEDIPISPLQDIDVVCLNDTTDQSYIDCTDFRVRIEMDEDHDYGDDWRDGPDGHAEVIPGSPQHRLHQILHWISHLIRSDEWMSPDDMPPPKDGSWILAVIGGCVPQEFVANVRWLVYETLPDVWEGRWQSKETGLQYPDGSILKWRHFIWPPIQSSLQWVRADVVPPPKGVLFEAVVDTGEAIINDHVRLQRTPDGICYYSPISGHEYDLKALIAWRSIPPNPINRG